MRLIRLGAFVGWAAMASFAVAGFAAFAPTEAVPATPATSVISSTTGDTSRAVGLLAGRVAAMNFTSSDTTKPAPDLSALISARVGPTTTTTTTTTTVSAAAPRTQTTLAQTPTTTAPPAAPRDYSNVPADASPWRSLVEAYFAPPDVDRALWVIHCESRGDPNAVHPASGAAGLFQHLPKFWEDRSAKAGIAGADIFSPDSNVAVAAWLVYSGGGWRHWNPSAHCWG